MGRILKGGRIWPMGNYWSPTGVGVGGGVLSSVRPEAGEIKTNLLTPTFILVKSLLLGSFSLLNFVASFQFQQSGLDFCDLVPQKLHGKVWSLLFRFFLHTWEYKYRLPQGSATFLSTLAEGTESRILHETRCPTRDSEPPRRTSPSWWTGQWCLGPGRPRSWAG